MKRTPDKVQELFLELEPEYSDRNTTLDRYESFFDGKHWDEQESSVESSSFQLVFNFCRAIVIKYSALLAKPPRFRLPSDGQDFRVRHRELFLQAIRDAMAPAWSDVEFNASKLSFGVLQVLWEPGPDQPESVSIGEGEDISRTDRYTESPFVFRSIPPKRFYPVYRTFDKPDDFLYVIRYDPNRLVEDLEQRYGVSLQPTSYDSGQWGSEGTCDLIEYWDDEDYHLVALTKFFMQDKHGKRIDSSSAVSLKEFAHKYHRVPFFVLQNIRNPNYDPTFEGSLGDIDSIYELNKHYNLVMSEAAEEIVTNIHRPLTYKSDDHQQDPTKLEMSPGAVYPIGAEESLDPVAWQPMPDAVRQHIEMTLGGIMDLSFLGQSGFGSYPTGASGVGLRLVLQSLEQILMLKLPLRIEALRGICKHVLRTARGRLKEDEALSFWVKDSTGRFGQAVIEVEDIGTDTFVDISYENLIPRDEMSFQQNEIYKYKTGAQSLWTTLDHLGFDDPDSEIELIKEEMQDDVLNPEKAAMILQAKQLPGTAQPETRPVQPGPPMQGAPPMPAPSALEGAMGPGGLAPYMGREQAPNFSQGIPGPGMSVGNVPTGI